MPSSDRVDEMLEQGYILKIDTLCLEVFYPQRLMKFSQRIFRPKNRSQVEHNIVSFGLN